MEGRRGRGRQGEGMEEWDGWGVEGWRGDGVMGGGCGRRDGGGVGGWARSYNFLCKKLKILCFRKICFKTISVF